MKRNLIIFAYVIHLFLGIESAWGTQILKEYPQFSSFVHMALQGNILWLGSYEYGVVRLNTVDDTYRYYDLQDGLLDLSIRSIAADKIGKVWFGTDSGVSCFNDDRWENYTYAGKELMHTVSTVAVDNNNNLWINCINFNETIRVNKIFKYDGVNWTKIIELKGQTIWQIVTGNDGSLWFCQGGGKLTRYMDGNWTEFPYKTCDGTLYFDYQGNLWFFGYFVNMYKMYSLKLYKYDSESFTQYDTFSSQNGSAEFGYNSVVTNQGLLWCTSHLGLAVFDGNNWYGPGPNCEEGRESMACVIDSQQNIWIYSKDLYVVSGNDVPECSWPYVLKVNEASPTEFISLINTPNPFNSSTVISYSLPNRSDVRLDVFDITGRKVTTLISSRQDKGNHQLTWQTQNEASGVYFLRIQADRNVNVKKMLLLR
jgi:ligand-binding sensor domain-containing protein